MMPTSLEFRQASNAVLADGVFVGGGFIVLILIIVLIVIILR